MRSITYTGIMITLVAVGHACASTSFEGGWRLISINSFPISYLDTDKIPYFAVAGMEVTGFDGCNYFFGRIDQPGNISATRIGCSEAAVKIPLNLHNMLPQLRASTVEQDFLSIPANGLFPKSIFQRISK